jgi:Zn-dependent protease
VALREADIIAELFTFAGNITFLHQIILNRMLLLRRNYSYSPDRSQLAGPAVILKDNMVFDYSLSGLIIIVVSILVGMSIHEATHAYVGLKLGDTTAADQGRISLNPFRHVDPITTILLPIVTLILFHAPILAAKPVQFNPERVKYREFGSAMIAAAGPLSNFLLAIIGALFVRNVPFDAFVSNALVSFVEINVLLFIFNFIPIPPLDGSRVLYAFAPEPLQNLMNQIEPFGLIIIFALVLLGGAGGILLSVDNAVLQHLL